ncbi:MAG: archaeosortase/exosortase family protein, partial [Cyanobacteria bacterium P01_G01_bin.49]
AVAGFLLQQLRVNSHVNGIYLYVNNIPVEVAPYCAGLKMLFTSLYVSLLLLHWTGNLSNRNRIVTLLSSAVVISVIANIIRNTLLAVFHGHGQAKAFEILHDGWGGDIYSVVMLIAIIGVNSMLERIENSSSIITETDGGKVDE